MPDDIHVHYHGYLYDQPDQSHYQLRGWSWGFIQSDTLPGPKVHSFCLAGFMPDGGAPFIYTNVQ